MSSHETRWARGFAEQDASLCSVNGDLIGSDPVHFSQTFERDAPMALTPEEIGLACSILGVEVPPTHVVDTLRVKCGKRV